MDVAALQQLHQRHQCTNPKIEHARLLLLTTLETAGARRRKQRKQLEQAARIVYKLTFLQRNAENSDRYQLTKTFIDIAATDEQCQRAVEHGLWVMYPDHVATKHPAISTLNALLTGRRHPTMTRRDANISVSGLEFLETVSADNADNFTRLRDDGCTLRWLSVMGALRTLGLDDTDTDLAASVAGTWKHDHTSYLEVVCELTGRIPRGPVTCNHPHICTRRAPLAAVRNST